MGLLDFLPETTDPKELEDRSFLEEVLKGVMRARTEEDRNKAVDTFTGQVGGEKAKALLIGLLAGYEQAAAETPVTSGAAKVLQQMGESAVEPLIEALGSDSAQTRKRAAMILGKIGDKRAVDPLKVLLDDRTSYVREAALDALDELGAGDDI